MSLYGVKRDLVLYALVFVASAYLCTTLEGLEFETRAFPAAILMCLMAVCAVGFIYTLLSAKRGAAEGKKEENTSSKLVKFCFTFFGTVVYALAIPYAGFYCSSAVFVLSLMILLGSRKRLSIILTALCTMSLLYVVFTLFLHVPLPKGMFM